MNVIHNNLTPVLVDVDPIYYGLDPAGVEAAIFASRGMTGAKNVLEGKFGFYPLYEAGEYRREVLADRLGSWFESEAASLKPYPSCRFCHGTIDAILDMIESDGLSVHDVESVVVKMPKEAGEMTR